MKKSELYITKRKIKAFLESLCFYILRIVPVDNTLVSVCTFEGKGGFGCNPKYVVKKLHEIDKDVKFVWFVNKDVINEKKFPEYIKAVPNTILGRAYYLNRSKVWIDNYRKPYGTRKRKNQYYINVNHYTMAIKCTGLWRGDGFSKMAYLVSKADSDMIDDLVIDSTWCEYVTPKGLVFDGNLLNTGAPRCDALYGDRKWAKKAFYAKLNLPEDAKVVMFAPTFREGAKDGKRFVYSELWSIDFEKMISAFEEKFGGKWFICVRVHPQLANTFDDYEDDKLGDRIINESRADDMYEILAAMDAYITDYSSACFEAAFAKIPTFIYADDIKKYAHDRGNLMWNLATDSVDNIRNNRDITPEFDLKFPFSLSQNTDELINNILTFDQDKYGMLLDDFYSKMGLKFDGKASERIAKIIIEKQHKGK